MGQSTEQRKGVFDRIRRHADMGRWQGGPANGVVVRLTTMDSAEDVDFQILEALVGYAKENLDVEFQLVGGGTGCFDMILAAETDISARIEDAVENDPSFQQLLNELNTHLFRIRKGAGTQTFAAHIRIKTAFATNRKRHDDRACPDQLFAATLSDEMTYGFAEFLVMDLARGQPRASFLKRIWRKVTLTLGDIFNGRQDMVLDRVDLVEQLDFQKLLEKSSTKGALVSIHGFANDFRDAMHATAKMVYRSRIEQLDLLPVIFSWPSPGSKVKYLPDITTAENSRMSLGWLLQLLANLPAAKTLSLMAHSHGCKMLVEAIGEMPKAGTPRFSRAILVEPDVDATFLEQRIGMILQVAGGLTVYHSSNDLALALSGALFKSKRAGRKGLETSMAKSLPAMVEIVDASQVASGLVRHSPHVDSAEVIGDIRSLLEGKGPESRQYLSPTAQPNRWQLRSA